jgi:hypothetical protein
MVPADPNQSAPERDPYEPDEAELDQGAPAPSAADLDGLCVREDVPGLLALARACRAGTAPGGRDMKTCLEAYRAAAALGSAEAEFAVALFQMNGGTVVAQDLKEGSMRLRSAAEKGSVPARVYLGNLYELGIHYKQDSEKADVWYRNAARGARVEAEQGSDEWRRALADLGCARHVLHCTAAPELDEAEKARLVARAKAHGYGLRVRDDAGSDDRATFVDALAGAEASALTGTPPPVAVDLAPRQRKDTSPETLKAKRKAEDARAQSQPPPRPAADPRRAAAEAKKAAETSARRRAALGAFGYCILFAVAGTGAAYAATLGARELVASGHPLPLAGTNTRVVFPVALAAFGVLPAWLVYELGAMLKALVLGAAVGAVGWVAWGTGRGAFHSDRELQALAFALAGFLAALLVLGLLGGAKVPRSSRPR